MSIKLLILIGLAVLAESKSWQQQVKEWQRIRGNRPIKQLFRVEGPKGPMSIKTYAEAEKLCKKEKAVIADSWRMRDDVEQKFYWKCAGCAWLKRAGRGRRVYYKNFRPICGEKEEDGKNFYKSCEDDPKDEGLDGYDVLCYGVSGPEIPPDSVAINVGLERGYVFVLREGAEKTLPRRTDAGTACSKRASKLATGHQVNLAWHNGMSTCACGWMTNTQGISMRDKISDCGNEVAVAGCHYGSLIHAYCFLDARAEPRGMNLVDFSELGYNTFPGAIEEGATQIDGGYVYITQSLTGPMTTRSIVEAYGTCSQQGAKVATYKQLKEAASRGMDVCHCAWTWESDRIKLMFNSLVTGNPGSNAVNKVCNKRVSSCSKTAGSDVFCYKVCPNFCPPGRQWNIPYRAVKVADGYVFHMDEGEKYQYRSKSAASSACEKKNGQLATRQQLEQAQKRGMTRCRCGYLSDGSVAFPIYRRIEGCGGTYGVFKCPGRYKHIPERGPNWDAYCFISNERLKSTNKYKKSLMPNKPVPVVGFYVEEKGGKADRSRASAGGHGVDDGKSMVKDFKQKRKKKIANQKRKARLDRQKKAKMHASVAGR